MSEIKVNKISPRTACGTTTLGDSGDTFTIPAGVSITNNGTASGFGATGAASWNTTVKTSTFTATSGEGYFVNTTGGAITVNLPAGSAGAVVAIKDYANAFSSNNCTVAANGSDKIGGYTNDAILSTNGIAITLIFIDSTQGWLVTDDGLQSSADNSPFIVATGGTITTSGNDTIHTFTGPGTFCVSKIANCAANNVVSYMVVAGGASGGRGDSLGAGGGAGGFREVKSPVTPYTASPLDGYPSAPNRVTVTATSFPITVGAGGAARGAAGTAIGGNSGSNSSFSTITSAGGGAGGAWSTVPGTNGGSGGGGGASGNTKGDGNVPPVSPPQGNDGGNRHPAGDGVGGGGGATAAGADASTGNARGGDGATTSINGTPTARAGGGGGAASFPATCGGAGGGGDGGYPGAGTAGTVNTGGGGGGNGPVSTASGAGGSGIVIIRYKTS